MQADQNGCWRAEIGYISATRSQIPTTVLAAGEARVGGGIVTGGALTQRAAPFIAAEMENDDNDDAASFLSCLVKWVASGLRHVRKMLEHICSRVTSTCTYVFVQLRNVRIVRVRENNKKQRIVNRQLVP